MLSATAEMLPPALFLPVSASRSEQLPLADEVGTRALLIGPPQSGKTSLLLQFAYARARRGLTTLFVCHSREKMWAQRPARPRSGDEEDEAQNLAVLRRVHIKYIKSDRELRELLIGYHLGSEGLPHTLIIDDLPAIIADPASGPDVASPLQGSPAGPSPSKAAAYANMHLALAAGLAAHAADHMDATHDGPPPATGHTALASSSNGGDGAGAPRARAVLLVSCSAPTADMVQLLSRWLPAQLRVARTSAHGVGTPGSQPHATYTLSSTHALAPPDVGGLEPPHPSLRVPPELRPAQYSLASEGRLVQEEPSPSASGADALPPRTPTASLRPPIRHAFEAAG
eukprot:Transcript_18719.p1 GENE.Transcript_18719~~Transcript_18719.p1  ORF type:complete len:342 (-),score=84.07 Transcript_18719:76-1101(-)